MDKSKKGFSEIAIILVIVVIGLIVGFLYIEQKDTLQLQPLSSDSPVATGVYVDSDSPFSTEVYTLEEDEQPFVLGNFIFNPESSYIKRTRQQISYDPDSVTEVPIYVSKTLPHECGRPGNIFSIYTERNLAEPKGAIPFIRLTSFDTKNLEFSSSAAEEVFFTNFSKMKNDLEKYSNFDVLYEEMFNNKAGDLIAGFTSSFLCGGGAGGWSYPLYVEKISNDKYDNVYYAEVNYGNGDLEGLPNRVLFVNKADSWLIIKAVQEYNKNIDWTVCYPKSFNSDSTRDKLKCVEEITREYRDDTENQKWIERMLSYITYSP